MKIFIPLLFCLSLYADIKNDMLHLYKNGNFEQACNLGYPNFQTYKNDQEFISLYSFSCLQSDYIDRLAIPIISLRYSQEERANASYFSIILMQKKLLYHALLDNYDISIYSLPTTEYVLSKVFDLYTKLGKHEPRNFYLFKDENNPRIMYKLYTEKGNRTPKMIIEEFENSQFLKRHIYW